MRYKLNIRYMLYIMIKFSPKTENIFTIFDQQKSLIFVNSNEMPMINRSNDLISYYDLFDLNKEIAIAFLFDKDQRSIGHAISPYGSFNGIQFSTRELVKISLENNAKSIILAHHHPSGDFNPSLSDINSTKLINSTLRALGINLYDHNIYSEHGFFSFKTNGLI